MAFENAWAPSVAMVLIAEVNSGTGTGVDEDPAWGAAILIAGGPSSVNGFVID